MNGTTTSAASGTTGALAGAGLATGHWFLALFPAAVLGGTYTWARMTRERATR